MPEFTLSWHGIEDASYNIYVFASAGMDVYDF
jgi:hypothetical protein